jgi:hypothetical protein
MIPLPISSYKDYKERKDCMIKKANKTLLWTDNGLHYIRHKGILYVQVEDMKRFIEKLTEILDR